MYCMYCGVPKGTSQVEVISNSENITLTVIELCWSEGISQLVRLLVTCVVSVYKNFKMEVSNWKRFKHFRLMKIY